MGQYGVSSARRVEDAIRFETCNYTSHAAHIFGSSERSFGLSLMNSRRGWTAITGIIASLNRPEMHLVAESISAPQHATPGTRTGGSDKTSYQTVGGNSPSSTAALRLLSGWDREKSDSVLKRLILNIKMAYVFSAVFRSFLGGGYTKIRLNSHSFWQLVSAVKLEVIWHRRPGNIVFIPPCFSSSGATLKQAPSIHRKEHISLLPLMWVAGEKKAAAWVFQPSSHTALYCLLYKAYTPPGGKSS